MIRANFIFVFLGFTALLWGQTNPSISIGPFIGHLSPDSANVWVKVSEEGSYFVRLSEQGGVNPYQIQGNASVASDLTITWRLESLKPNTHYNYSVTTQNLSDTLGTGFSFQTPPAYDQNQEVSLLFGSCVRDNVSNPIWQSISDTNPDILVLLGDTPYIDNTSLSVQVRRYSEFASNSEIEPVLKKIPFYGVWDDHDFGLNDTDGNLNGKENSRQAFSLYRPNFSHGDGTEGVYTKFRRGPIEVFLLDTRYFAGTEESPFQSGETTLLGTKQWAWLKQGLMDSKASFKLLASGMIWNGAVRPGKPDHWNSYQYEMDELFRFIGANQISGVMLMGGDVHRSRVLRYPSTAIAGYEIYEFITSPMHSGVIAAANAPHPNLVIDVGDPFSYLLMNVNNLNGNPILGTAIMTADGREHYQLNLQADSLRNPNWPVNIKSNGGLELKNQFIYFNPSEIVFVGFKKLLKIDIFNIQGNKVRTIPVGKDDGSVVWDRMNYQRERVNSGIYLLKIHHKNKKSQFKSIFINGDY